MSGQQDNYDSPWKDMLKDYFKAFLEFFFPYVAEDVDWKSDHEFLDTELRQITKNAELGRRYADKLAKLRRKSGEERWVMMHVEVQGWEDPDFEKRVFTCNYRIFDVFDKPAASLVVLADERTGWRPDRFGYTLWGCEVGIRFPTVKITDYIDRWDELEKNDNPFALVVMAHLKTKETRGDGENRRRWKLYLIRKLYERRYKREDVVNLFRFIDWLMDLPKEFDKGFWQELSQFEEKRKMPYVTSVERLGYERGKEEAEKAGRLNSLIAAIEMGLSIKFGDKGLRFLPTIQKLKDIGRLESIKEIIKATDNLSEIESALA